MTAMRPAWSWQRPTADEQLRAVPGLDTLTREWAWAGSTGAGIKVAVIDSGVDNDHPAIAGRVKGFSSFFEDANRQVQSNMAPHTDSFGHGTACADIIRRVAPDVDLYSVKVLGARLSGKGSAFASALRWAIEAGMQVINLSLGTTKQEHYSVFYELADLAYFRGSVLVTAANNMPIVSYPSLLATVVSVACHDGRNPYEFYSNPTPPVEFLAPGVDIEAAWLDGTTMTVTGNSFSAPHITGIVAKILSKHPGLTPSDIKTILRATASNIGPHA